jgi:hypothetical protein
MRFLGKFGGECPVDEQVRACQGDAPDDQVIPVSYLADVEIERVPARAGSHAISLIAAEQSTPEAQPARCGQTHPEKGEPQTANKSLTQDTRATPVSARHLRRAGPALDSRSSRHRGRSKYRTAHQCEWWCFPVFGLLVASVRRHTASHRRVIPGQRSNELLQALTISLQPCRHRNHRVAQPFRQQPSDIKVPRGALVLSGRGRGNRIQNTTYFNFYRQARYGRRFP